MLLQKIEFWLFSVPALVVAICGIAHSRATSRLWARGAGLAARWAIGALEGHTGQRRMKHTAQTMTRHYYHENIAALKSAVAAIPTL